MEKFAWELLLLCLAFLPHLTNQVGQSCILSENYYTRQASFKLPHQNCTHIIGDIMLMYLGSVPVANDAELANIEEVTGFVRIYAGVSSPVKINFPKLRIIRGERLVRFNLDDPEYALLVSDQNLSNFTVEFPALREVSRGSVGVFSKRRMCFFERMNWMQIMKDKSAKFHYFPSFDENTMVFANGSENNSKENCDKCHPSCLDGCWGVEEENCQRFQCSHQCQGGSCFGSGSEECCHSLCAIGCSGPSASECEICRYVNYDGECRESCPLGKYFFGVNCVDSCPEGSVLDEEAKGCFAECPENKWKEGNKCVEIPSNIRKCKRHSTDNIINSVTVSRIQDCNLISGSISIVGKANSSAKHVHHHNLTHTTPTAEITETNLTALNNIRVVTGSIQILHWNQPEMSAFSNLEEIGGSLFIAATKLESLHFPVLRRVNGGVVITANLNLCFIDTIKWSNITGSSLLLNVMNRHEESCKRDGRVCSDNCSENGCWGEGPENCVCLEYRQEGRCVSSCDSEFLRDGHRCVKSCGVGKYVQNGECLYCHESCESGCSGPERTRGLGGCLDCWNMQIVDGVKPGICMKVDEDCPADHSRVPATKYYGRNVTRIRKFYKCRKNDPSTMSTPLILCIVAGALVVILVYILGLVWYCKRKSANPVETNFAKYTTLNSAADSNVEIL